MCCSRATFAPSARLSASERSKFPRLGTRCNAVIQMVVGEGSFTAVYPLRWRDLRDVTAFRKRVQVPWDPHQALEREAQALNSARSAANIGATNSFPNTGQ